eukprot:g475.t1
MSREVTAEKSEGFFAQVGIAAVQLDEVENARSGYGKLSASSSSSSSVLYTTLGDLFVEGLGAEAGKRRKLR